MFKKLNLTSILSVVVISLFISVIFVYAASWAPPVSSPPACPDGSLGCDTPVNTGSGSQIKSGGLWLGGLGVDGGAYLSVSGGNTGIGTVNPSEKLDVQGRARFVDTQIWDNEINRYGGDNLYIQYRDASAAPDIGVPGNTILNFNGGNVGIGIGNPAEKLQVGGNIIANGTIESTSGGLKFPDGTVLNTAPGPSTDDLQKVTDRGNTTINSITIGGSTNPGAYKLYVDNGHIYSAGSVVANGGFYPGNQSSYFLGYDGSNLTANTNLQVNGKSVCLQNGVNCPAAAAPSPHGKQRFTSNGTFTVPTGVTTVWVTMSGGGGGGGGARGGGGGGGTVIAKSCAVTPGDIISIIVGSGGFGGRSGGGNGGNSVFTGCYTVSGGSGGTSGGGSGGSEGVSGGSGGGGGGRRRQCFWQRWFRH